MEDEEERPEWEWLKKQSSSFNATATTNVNSQWCRDSKI